MANDRIKEIKTYIDEISHSAKSVEGIFDNIGKKAISALQDQIKASGDLIEHYNALAEAGKMDVRIAEEKIAKLLIQNALAGRQISLEETRKNLYTEAGRNAGEAVVQAGVLKDTMTNLLNPTTAFAQLTELTTKRFFQLDKAAEDFRLSTGLVVSQTAEIDANVKALSRDFAEYGLDIEKAYGSAKALTEVFGDQFMASNKENVKFIGLMSANLGVSETTSAQILQKFMGVANMTSKSAQNMALGASSLAKAAGVPIGVVMKDMAEASGDTLTMLRGSVKELVRGTVEARRLGTDLKDVAAAGRQMLNFQESVANEMEASVLFGKNINIQHARELAYKGDTVGLMNEQNRILQSMGDINKMDVFQQEALAKTLGMSTDEMFKRKAKQEELNELQRKSPDLFKKYTQESEALAKGAANVEDRYANELLQMQVQAEQTKLANSFKQIMVSISDILVPVVKLIMVAFNIFTFIMKPVVFVLKTLSGWFDALGAVTSKLEVVQSTTKSVSEFFKNNPWVEGLIGVGMIFLAFKKNLITNMLSPFKSVWGTMTGLFKKGMPSMGSSVKMSTPASGKSGGGVLDGMTDSINKIKPVKILAVGAAMVLFAASLWIMAKAGQEFSKVDWSTMAKMAAAAGLMGITLGVMATVLAPLQPIIWPMIAAMLAFSLSMMGLGVAALLLGKGINFAADGFTKLADLSLFKLALGIYALSGAMISFGAAMAGGGIMSFLGGGMMLQLMGLAAISPLLEKTSGALNIITESLTTFKDKEIVSGINAVTKAITDLNKELEKTSTMKLMALAAVNVSAAGVATAGGGEGGNTSQKLDELIGLMKSGAIAVNIDGNRASYLLANNKVKRGGLGAIAG